MGYFFAALSTRENLKKCEELALAGFPQTRNGVWAYVDIDVGDFVSFLYGAKAHGLYEVVEKLALESPESLSFWEPIHSKKGDIYFPYLLRLRPVRELNEPLARSEFLYITENLLRRGGIRKSHFQADQTTLQNASQMGKVWKGDENNVGFSGKDTFVPRFAKGKDNVKPPEVNLFFEKILQSLLRHHLLKKEILKNFIEEIGVGNLKERKLEVLGELALESGYVDLLVKEAEPIGTAKQIVIEVKTGPIRNDDVKQVLGYMNELGEECEAGALVGGRLARNLEIPADHRIHPWKYEFHNIDIKEARAFNELLTEIEIKKVEI